MKIEPHDTVNVATDPDMARKAFAAIVADSGTDPTARWLLSSLFDAVMIDLITNGMETNDEYALVTGRRIQTLLAAAIRTQSHQRTTRKKVKTP